MYAEHTSYQIVHINFISNKLPLRSLVAVSYMRLRSLYIISKHTSSTIKSQSVHGQIEPDPVSWTLNNFSCHSSNIETSKHVVSNNEKCFFSHKLWINK